MGWVGSVEGGAERRVLGESRPRSPGEWSASCGCWGGAERFPRRHLGSWRLVGVVADPDRHLCRAGLLRQPVDALTLSSPPRCVWFSDWGGLRLSRPARRARQLRHRQVDLVIFPGHPSKALTPFLGRAVGIPVATPQRVRVQAVLGLSTAGETDPLATDEKGPYGDG